MGRLGWVGRREGEGGTRTIALFPVSHAASNAEGVRGEGVRVWW